MFVCLFFHYIYHKAEWFEVSMFSNRAVLWLQCAWGLQWCKMSHFYFCVCVLDVPFWQNLLHCKFYSCPFTRFATKCWQISKAKDLRLIWNTYLMPFVVAWIWSFCKWAKIVMRFGSYGFVSWCALNVVAAKPKLHTFFRKRQTDKLLRTVV